MDTLSSPPLPLPPPPPPPPLPQPSRSQTPPPSQHYSSANSEGASGRVSSSLLPTIAEPPSTIVMVSEEETEGEGAEGEAVYNCGYADKFVYSETSTLRLVSVFVKINKKKPACCINVPTPLLHVQYHYTYLLFTIQCIIMQNDNE